MTSVLPRDGVVCGGAYLYPVRVYYEDTDAAGLVYHANYLKFAERARTEMLRRLDVGQERLRAETGIVFVARRCTVEYLRPARLDDDLVIETRIGSVAAATLELNQNVYRGESMLARLALEIACIGPSGRPRRLPAILKTSLASLSNPESRMVTTHAR